jgi:hypothetical protein
MSEHAVNPRRRQALAALQIEHVGRRVEDAQLPVDVERRGPALGHGPQRARDAL